MPDFSDAPGAVNAEALLAQAGAQPVGQGQDAGLNFGDARGQEQVERGAQAVDARRVERAGLEPLGRGGRGGVVVQEVRRAENAPQPRPATSIFRMADRAQ